MSSRPIHLANPRSEIRTSVALSPFTTWGIGGRAQLLYLPADREDLERVLDRHASVRVLGNGSNILIADREFEEPILVTRRLNSLEISGSQITAGAGVLLPFLAQECAKASLSGLEYAVGVPGTVGGATRMNAGAHGQEWKEVLREVGIVRPGSKYQRIDGSACGLSYRHSLFQTEWQDAIIVDVRLELVPAEQDKIYARMQENVQWRHEKTPYRERTCGSVFRRGAHFFPGEVIERAGLKGYRIGDAEVSEVHANYFINRGRATFSEMRALIHDVKAIVQEKLHIHLETEVILWE